ncbi:MAG: aldose 1-epimerase family protein [Marmoricola sp.]
MPDSTPPTGQQWTLEHSGYRATVVESGGGIRELTHDGVPVLAGYPLDSMPSGGRGQVLMPWPNRIRDGAWSFAGRDLQLPLSEPDKHNASHGLVRWASWREQARSDAGVTLGSRVMAQSGYPWTLDLTVSYRVSGAGLETTVAATNVSAEPAPFAAGMHPYLALSGPLASTPLLLPASTRLLTDERLLPVGEEAVAGTAYEFTAGREVGDLTIDDCFGDLAREPDGRAVVRLGDVELWVDGSWSWLQVFTGDVLPAGTAEHPVPPGTGPRESVAVEPMTAPPDAFSSGRDLLVLEPGASWSGSFGVRRL